MEIEHQQRNHQQKCPIMYDDDESNEMMGNESLSQKINSIVDNILGERAGETEKKEFLKSLFLITCKHSRELQKLMESGRSVNSTSNNLSNTNSPSINIYLVNSPVNSVYTQNAALNQAQYYPVPNFNPSSLYANSYQQPQIQQQIPIQSSQQPNFLFGPQQPQLFTEKKIHKSTSKKHKKKSDKKSKKDKSKSKDKKSSSKEKDSKNTKIMTFEYDGNSQLNGIMRYLNDQTHGNIHDNGTIEITSNQPSSSTLRYLVNYNNEDCFRSNSDEFTTICFDFKEKSIQPTYYAIKSLNNGPSSNGPFLRNWVIEVSNDKSKWTQIDQRSDESRLRESLKIGVFDVTQKTKKFYRYIRLRQTGNSWDLNGSGTRIILRGMDFFGKIKMPST